jgi:hypothetical protein
MLELALPELRAAAGEVVHGRVRTEREHGSVVVELVRVEQSPTGYSTYRIATADVDEDGSFTLTVPRNALPDVTGRECALHHSLRAVAGHEEVRTVFAVAP